jgi:DNA-binding NarL/FixJ family response regulator
MIDATYGLTKREWDALSFAAEGMNCREVAAEMGIALQTAKNHLHAAYDKLGARNLIEALNIVGWVQVPTVRISQKTWSAA